MDITLKGIEEVTTMLVTATNSGSSNNLIVEYELILEYLKGRYTTLFQVLNKIQITIQYPDLFI